MILFGKDISRRSFLRALAVAAGATAMRMDAAEAKKKKKKAVSMSRYRADLPRMAGAPAGSLVIPNSRYLTTNFVLEYDDGSFHTVAADEYRVLWRTGAIVKRSEDNDGNAVDWSSIDAYPFYWSGTILSPTSGAGTVTREAVTWYQENNPTPPIDAEGAIDLELMHDLFFNGLLVSGQTIQWVRDLTSHTENLTMGGVQTPAQAAFGVDVNINQEATDGLVRMTASNSDGTVAALAIYSTQATDKAYTNVSGQNGLSVSGAGVVNEPELSDGLGVDVDGKLLRLRTSKTPASAADTGNAGEICWDSSYVYVCVAANTWQRVAHATW